MAKRSGWSQCLAISHEPSAIESRWRFWERPHHAGELAALQQLPALASAPCHLVFRGADGLFGAPRGLHGEQIAVAAGGDEAEHAVAFAEFDEQYAFARPREVVHLVGLAQDAASLGGGGNQDLAAGEARDPHDLRPLRGAREAAAGAGARLDERLEAEAQRVAVARGGDGVNRGLSAFLLGGNLAR